MTSPLNAPVLDTPVLATTRLRLVAPRADHIAAYTRFVTSQRAADRGWAVMPHEAWRNFAAIMGHHLLRGFGPYVAEARDDGRALGLFGAWWPEGQAEAEIKWTIFAEQDEGKGFAAEAARSCLLDAFTRLGWTTAVSYIAPDNTRSAVLARHLGAQEDGTWTTPRGSLVRVFRHKPMTAADVGAVQTKGYVQ
jgi:RimJ/RimL family protein N-acetyltransferase